MSRQAVTQRLISAASGVDSNALRSGVGVNMAAVVKACGQLTDLPLLIDDSSALSVMELRSRSRRMGRRRDIGCIVIDYLQLLTAPHAARETRQVEVSTISRGIKALAREMDVPIVCLAQLNRASEQREGNRPRMADLRESGSIEQDADVVILLHREEYYHIQDRDWAIANPDKLGMAELIVAKQRNGPTGTVDLRWDSKTTRFRNKDQAGWQG
jgi:replicative DNA helicase